MADDTMADGTAEENGVTESVENAPVEAAPIEHAADAAAGDSATPELTFSSGLDIGSEAAEAPIRAPQTLRGRVLADGTAIGTGRRKTGVARVRIKKGSGEFTINGRTLENFFPNVKDRLTAEAPLRATEMHGTVDVWVRAEGGGTTGQAGAIVLGIARALQAMNPELHGKLSDGGYLTRDGRMVERKKYGHRKARRSFQFSKR